MKVGSYYWLDTSPVVNISIRLMSALPRIWRATLSGSTRTGDARPQPRLGRLKPCLTVEREGNNGIVSQIK